MSKLVNLSQRLYVTVMLDIVSRSLASAGKYDAELQHEISGFPVGMLIEMKILNGPGFVVQVCNDNTFKIVKKTAKKADLTVLYKHISLAFLVFSFQESTARSFANDRLIADGELSYAIRFMRCLSKVEALILPKVIAQLALKSYPTDLPLAAKVKTAALIYRNVAQSYLFRN